VREHQTPDTCASRHSRDGLYVQVPPDTADEPDRLRPSGAFREHEIRVARPRGKCGELRGPDDRTVASPDPVTVGRVIGMDHWPALDGQAISPEASGMRDDALLGGQSPDGGDELRALVRYEPRVEIPGRIRPGPAIDHHPDSRMGHEKTRRGVKRRSLRADTQRHEPHG
jgi:hypothetical protein